MQDEYVENRAGQRLRASIEGRGWSLMDFSRRSGVPYRSLQDYVSGKSKPGFDQLTKFADVGLDVAFVLTGQSPDHDKNALPDMMNLGGDHSVGRRAYKDKEVEAILSKVSTAFALRDWIDIWTLADDSVPPAKEFGFEENLRQGAVAFVASGVALGLIERMRALGWLAR